VLLSLCYLVLRRVLRLVALCCGSNDYKELEIVVLRHELAILRRQTRRPALTTVDRLFLAAASRVVLRQYSDRVLFHISADPLITQHARSNSAVLPGASADARGGPRRPRASP
jgi:hypothetical protein